MAIVLDQEIKNQLEEYLKLLENRVIIKYQAGEDSGSNEMISFLTEISDMSPMIELEEDKMPYNPCFQITRLEQDVQIFFAGVPMGHEFTSFVLALLQVSGRPPKVEEDLLKRIRNIKNTYRMETFISLSCHNCPEVVQSCNMFSLIQGNSSHIMVDGSKFSEEVEKRGVLAVPALFVNGEFFHSGRMELEELLDKLEEAEGQDPSEIKEYDPFDVLVVGGGPAGFSAAIYASRKGIRTGIMADKFGGQIRDTLGIENFIGTIYTEGPKLADQLELHAREYAIDFIKNESLVEISPRNEEGYLEVITQKKTKIKTRTLILATGARWRNVGVPGETELKNKGVAYCPHCDGPLFKNKDVVVIGGGNSGVEAAIDLAGIAAKVTVLEFLPVLKADEILQKRMKEIKNIDVITNGQTMEIIGSDKVQGVRYQNRDTKSEAEIICDGVFVQIGLVPNTEFLNNIEKNNRGEILIGRKNETSMAGVFAAGDCTDSTYKQIIISMGSGANAALGAFDYLIRGE